jgi:outer membrane protein assembly factor BamB
VIGVALAVLSCGARSGLEGFAPGVRPETEGGAPPAPLAPWPMSGHDERHTSRGDARGPQTPTSKWSVPLAPSGLGDVVVGNDGTIYVPGNGALFAVNPDGTTRWSTTLLPPPAYITSPAIGPDGTVYTLAGNDSSQLFAVNPDGSLRFGIDTRVGSSNAPLTIGDDGTLHAGHIAHLDAYSPDGTQEWDYVDVASETFASPAVGADGTVYATSDDFTLRAFSPTGTPEWETAAAFQVFAAPSVGSDGTIYFGSYDQNLYAVNPDGSTRWTFTTSGNIGYGSLAAPALGADGTIYVTCDDVTLGSFLYAVTAAGSQKWMFQPAGRFLSPGLLDREGTFYIPDTNGTLYAVDATGAVKFTLAIGTGEGAPALGADGTLYIGTDDGELHAIGP